MGLASQVQGQPPSVSGSMGKRGTWLCEEVAQMPGSPAARELRARKRGAGGGRGRRPGIGRGRRRLPGWGCVWVCPGRARGVLREGLAKGAGPRARQPRAKGVEGRRVLGGEVGRRLSAPGAGCKRDAARERRVRADGAGVRGPEPSQGAAPTSGGGNGPEWAGTPSRK